MAARWHKCVAGCGRTITWRFAICTECEKVYGRSAKHDWPEWLRFLWNSEQKERAMNRNQAKFEVPLEVFDDE